MPLARDNSDCRLAFPGLVQELCCGHREYDEADQLFMDRHIGSRTPSSCQRHLPRK
jgi:hypothetical protein